MAKKKRSLREAEKRRVEYASSRQRLERRRIVVGLLSFIPLAVSLGCGTPVPLGPLCALSRDWWILIWAALFGSFLGITIRLVLDRRKFERETPRGPAA